MTLMKNKKSFLKSHISMVLFFAAILFLEGCSPWKATRDSCIYESEEPPLRRVVNYNDHGLCGRKLPPRTPPNPRLRRSPQMN